MLRTTSRCPCCSQPLEITWDMWGQFYVCQDCGFTAEDDDELERERRWPSIPPWLAQRQSPRPWQVQSSSGQATERR